MKRSKWMTLLSVLLVLCLAVQPVSAAGRRNSNRHNQSKSIDVRRENKRKEVRKEKNTETVTEESASSSETVAVMSLVEDETTVENGEMLRAATYNLMTADETGTTTDGEPATTLKYFPVTLYDYDENTINDATKEVERAANNGVNPEEWQGIYFSGGGPSPNATGTTVDKSGFVDGAKYYIQNARANNYYATQTAGKIWLKSDMSSESGAIISVEEQAGATLWTLTVNEDGTFSLKDEVNNVYMAIPNSGASGESLSSDKVNLSIDAYTGGGDYIGGTSEIAKCVIIRGNHYLCQQGSNTYYGGEINATDSGNAMLFYRVDETEQVLVTIKDKTTYDGPTFAEWNSWDKNSADNLSDNGDDNDNGQKTYTGLVESKLDANKDIVFTKPDGGIFNSDETVKSIYPGVYMPFVYDEDGFYTFDSSVHGVYFKLDSTQQSTASGEYTEDSTGTLVAPRLYFDLGNPQGWDGMNYADGSTNLWAPFNSADVTISDMNYHFGMRATVPFSMTPNGRVIATNDESEAIKFSFSGDDDVWVFIDGQLVIDLGGIHNRLDAEIDFAKNTVTYSATNNLAATQETGSYNDPDFELEQTLFGNLITQDRTTFAATDTHELTIFYLERGQGASNGRIKFNLPVNDAVVVTKDATRSWNSTTNVIEPLTETEQEKVNQIDFGFILYRSTDKGATFEPVTNTNYYLLNSNNQVISSPTTGADGHFYLKNGQSAKFITTQMDNADGVIYYVHEDAATGFVDPDYNYSGEAAKGYYYKEKVSDTQETYYENASLIPELEVFDGQGNSGVVTVCGSSESEDSITFLCSNFLDAKLPNPSALPAEDKIVVDYGLPVEIDVLVNDVYRGDTIKLVSVNGSGVEVDAETGSVVSAGVSPSFGTAQIVDGKIVYTLNKQLSSVEILNYVVKVTGKTVTEGTGTENIAYKYAVGTVYIIPATTMYYEENFDGLVNYVGSYWDQDYTVDASYQNTYQEPGVVGTIGDSPYGSDVAYLNDSKDSNGTSRHANTTNSTVRFSYSFKGTGTSFFARTTNNTGYMRVVVTDSTGAVIQSLYRDTVYRTEDNEATLYNVPVFTTDELDYGTYTVTVTVAKANETLGYHSDFWLDGIRVMQPLDSEDANYSVAAQAYATDSEQNMTNVTLRNKLIREADYDTEGNPLWNGEGFVLFTDSDGAIDTAEEYESLGPKEEVYMNDGQSVTFSLNDWDPNSNKIYLGMKAPFGTGTALVGNTTVNVNNAADCYYDITNYGTVTTDADGVKTVTFEIEAVDSLISVTNIKVTGNAEFVIIQENNEELPENEGEDVEIDGDEGEGEDVNIDGDEA